MKHLMGIFITLVLGIVLYTGLSIFTQPVVQAKPIAGQHSQASKAWMAECTTRRWYAHCSDDMRRLKSAGLWPW